MCEAMANDFFELDDDDDMPILDDSPRESDRAHVNAAVQACPVLALTLHGVTKAASPSGAGGRGYRCRRVSRREP